MAVAGSLTYSTKIDTSGFQKGINEIEGKTKSGGASVKSIIAGLGITKLISVAMNTIKESMDGAISRLDAMNNFPKVMSNLGIGAKESTEAINRLSDGLQGIPTTLDAGALAVQRFTSKNSDVQKSVDIFLAVNDAILAGGASTQIQESALEQLSQAYAKGKMDMMEWRTLQTAMPAQLKQVATAMGLTTDELGEMLRTGDNTEKVFDEFIGTIIEMDKTGVKGFKSLKEQARNATGGIQTSITNMKTAIVRGVANLLKEFDKVMKKKGLGGISENITKVGKQAEQLLKNIGASLPKIIDILLKVINVLIKFAPAIIGITTAITGYKLAIAVATTATNLFNSALALNPIVAITAGVVGLTTALFALSNSQKQSKSAVQELNESLNEYDKKMNEIAKNRKGTIKDGEAEIYSYQRLYTQLQMIVDENGKVKEGYEEKAELITGKLSQALGVEINLIDGQIQNYGELKTSVEEAIKAKKAEILLNAYEEEYTEALKKRKDLQEKYTAALKENEGVHAEYNKTLAEFNEAVKRGSPAAADLSAKLALLKKAAETSDEKMAKAGKTLNSNQEIISQYELGLDALANKNYEAVEKMYSDTVTFNGKTKEANDEKYKDEKASLENQLKVLKESKDKYDTETYDSMEKALKDQIDLLDENHKEANKKLEFENETTKKLTIDGINEQLKALTDHKYEFRDAGNGNMQLYIDEQEAGKAVSFQKMQELVNGSINILNSKQGDAAAAGSYLVDGLASGISAQEWKAIQAANSLANSVLGKVKGIFGISSPSKVFKQYGKWLDEGLIQGIDAEKNKVLKDVDIFGDDVVNRMADAVNIQVGKMAFSGTAGSVNQILTATGTTTVINKNKLLLDGEVVYENQKKVSARKNLQTQFGGAYNVSN